MKKKLDKFTLDYISEKIDEKILGLRTDSEIVRISALKANNHNSPLWKDWNAIGSKIFIYEEIKRDILK